LPEALPAPEVCREWLRHRVAREIAELVRLEQELRLGRERETFQRTMKMALLPGDPESARLFDRYYSESCSKFFRAFTALPKVLERDAEGFFDDLAELWEDDDDAPPEPPEPCDPDPATDVQEDDSAPHAGAAGGPAPAGAGPPGAPGPPHPAPAARDSAPT